MQPEIAPWGGGCGKKGAWAVPAAHEADLRAGLQKSLVQGGWCCTWPSPQQARPDLLVSLAVLNYWERGQLCAAGPGPNAQRKGPPPGFWGDAVEGSKTGVGSGWGQPCAHHCSQGSRGQVGGGEGAPGPATWALGHFVLQQPPRSS